MPTSHLSLILASQSPQRRALLAQEGYQFRVIAPRSTAECGICSKETPGELVARLARQKAADIAERFAAGLPAASVIVGCDTVAECLGQILGKPVDRGHAQTMLRLLSGREHHVYSGLCLWPAAGGNPRVRVAITRLRMETLGPDEIDQYLDSGQWEGKAGGFGLQDRPGWLHLVSGSESNVIGLPLELLAEMLNEWPPSVD
ncbi:MAG TPA: Maf family protein [Pirellulales bacterium]|jgi:septum formation protein|nr:Maf family protein [Pirellulales bacterium]